MCGIAGIIGTKEAVTTQRLKTLASSLAHRGPDDEGIEVLRVEKSDCIVGLVHRRLSIIDLSSAGHQPMQDPVTCDWIVFNGEIYNYRELKTEFEQAGDLFRSTSDTEVILKAYARWGVACLDRFRGMFAFALWDAKQKKLFCAVDRFGIKPFYFFHHGNTLAFASEVQALIISGVVTKTIDSLAVDSFLSFGAVQAPRTMIDGVRAMLPATYIVYDSAQGNLVQETYWKPHSAGKQMDIGLVLEDTVRHHLVSDVPVGLFLSGGVDSSALAILAHRVAGKTLDAFSVTFEEKTYAEGQYARMIGEKFCARHHELMIRDADLDGLLPSALDAMDQPTIDGVNAYVISKAVHDTGIKVVLSGQGGDEVFGGYPTFRRIPAMMRWWKIARLMPRWQRQLLARVIGQGSVARSKFAQYLISNGRVDSFYAILRQLFNINDIQRLRLRSNRDLVSSSIENNSDALFNQISLLELRGYLANTLLRDGDVMSMAHGLEVRVPYLDHVLVEQVFKTPSRDKVDRLLPKPLLLQQVIDELPRVIYDRLKMGFTFPWELWLRGRLRGEVESTLVTLPSENVLGLNRHACLSLWHAFLEARKNITWSRVWALYVLCRWMKKHNL